MKSLTNFIRPEMALLEPMEYHVYFKEVLIRDRKLTLCTSKYIGKICLEAKFQLFGIEDDQDIVRSILDVKHPLDLPAPVVSDLVDI